MDDSIDAVASNGGSSSADVGAGDSDDIEKEASPFVAGDPNS